MKKSSVDESSSNELDFYLMEKIDILKFNNLGTKYDVIS